jgi:hypothetical protein
MCFFQLNPPLAEEIYLRWMKSLRDEIPLRGDKDTADLISSEVLAPKISSKRSEDFIVRSTISFMMHACTD